MVGDEHGRASALGQTRQRSGVVLAGQRGVFTVAGGVLGPFGALGAAFRRDRRAGQGSGADLRLQLDGAVHHALAPRTPRGRLVARVAVLRLLGGLGEQLAGDERHGGGAAVGGLAQGDPDAVPLGEPGDDEQADPVGVGELEVLGLRQPLVGVGQGVGGHAQTPVVYLQGEAVRDPLARDLHGGVRRREDRGVLQEFRDEVDQVGHRPAGHGERREPADLDAFEVLDLVHGGPHHVHELLRLAPLPGRGGAGEDDQALGVAPHAGGQVVEPDEVREVLVVGGAALQGLQQVELAVQQDLGAAGEVDEDLGDAAPGDGPFDGGRDGLALKGVDGAPDLAQLVPAVFEAGGLGLDVDMVARLQAAQHAGQPLLGGVHRLARHAAQLAVEAAGQAQGDDRGDDDDEQPADGDQARAQQRRVDARVELVPVGGVGLVGEHAEGGERLGAGLGPFLGVDGADAAFEKGLLDEGQQGARAGVPVVLVGPDVVVGQVGQVEVVDQLAPGDQVGQRAEFGVPGAARGERARHQGVFLGEGFTGLGEAGDGAGLPVEFHVADGLDRGEEEQSGRGEAVVGFEGAGPVDRAVRDPVAELVQVLQGGEERVQPLPRLVAEVGADAFRRTSQDAGHRLVGGGLEVAEHLGPPGVRDVDQGLPPLRLEGADDRVARFGEGVGRGGGRQHVPGLGHGDRRRERPDRHERQQGREHQRPCLPSDRLAAKAHALP